MKGILLIQLGTPDAPNYWGLRKYLGQFLMDGRVIDIPVFWRFLLVNGIITTFRSFTSAKAYRTVWTNRGSPLRFLTEDLAIALQKHFDSATDASSLVVRYAMRYGSPSIESVIQEMETQGVTEFVVCPLYPQYAAASSASSLAEAFRVFSTRWNVPTVSTVPAFYEEPAYLSAVAESLRQSWQKDEHLLLSFHGLPERQLMKSDSRCVKENYACCDLVKPYCYRSQSVHLVQTMKRELGRSDISLSFQSRLGRTPWITPYTDEVLKDFPKKGIRRLAVACPSFVTDCLETLEEIQERGKETFMEAGGESFRYIPCLNAQNYWVAGLAQILQKHL
jgi:ferrochelatase